MYSCATNYTYNVCEVSVWVSKDSWLITDGIKGALCGLVVSCIKFSKHLWAIYIVHGMNDQRTSYEAEGKIIFIITDWYLDDNHAPVLSEKSGPIFLLLAGLTADCNARLWLPAALAPVFQSIPLHNHPDTDSPHVTNLFSDVVPSCCTYQCFI